MRQTVEPQPVFDPDNPGQSLQVVREQFPVTENWLDGTLFGDITSRLRGQGLEKDGVRDYVPGDNPRDVDMPATARHPNGQLQVRLREKDITPDLVLVTDVPKRHYSADTDQYHQEQRLGMSAVMAMLSLADINSMPSAVVAAGDHGLVSAMRQPHSGRLHLMNTAQMLANSIQSRAENSRGEPQSLTGALRFASRYFVRSMVAVVSDFREETAEDGQPLPWAAPLRQLKKQGNQILAVELVDPFDFKLRALADRHRDARKNQAVFVGADRLGQAIRERVAINGSKQQAAIDGVVQSLGAAHIKLRTDEPRWRDSLRDQLRAQARQRLSISN